MTEQQLIYFTTIVSTGSYSETALELDISQSSISRQIISLEEELGVRLFNRQKRQVSLTAAGQKLYPQAVNILEQIRQMKTDATKLQPDYKSKLPLLVLPITGQLNFFVLVSRFELEYPQFSIEMTEVEEPAMFRRVSNGDYQMALTYQDSYYLSNHLPFTPILRDEIMLAVPEQSPLSRRDIIRPEDLNGQRLMLMEDHTCINHFCSQYLKQHQLKPTLIGCGRPESILGAVDAGRCSAMVTRLHSNTMLQRNIRLIPIEGIEPAILGIIVNPAHVSRRGIQRFLQICTENYRQNLPEGN